ncbi:MACRO domain-containing protein [Hypoxylon sp. FL1150]|nr:MACRO domain-containing protein [Hypoxylon sp. FL1150]
MTPIHWTDIPSLTLLYKLNKLDASRSAPLEGASSVHNDHIGVYRGDITKVDVDAIVNAANESLLGGGGVDGAIHRAAGRGLLAECRTLGGCPTGESKITSAYNLPCKKVIHTVGPIYRANRDAESEAALRGCYRSSLQLAVQHNLKTIAFSAVSTGVYGYPSLDAADVACDTVRTFMDSEDGQNLEKVVFVTFEEKDVRAYNHTLPRHFPPDSRRSADQEAATEAQTAEAEAKASQLPNVPTKDPTDSEHAQKKQKQDRVE